MTSSLHNYRSLKIDGRPSSWPTGSTSFSATANKTFGSGIFGFWWRALADRSGSDLLCTSTASVVIGGTTINIHRRHTWPSTNVLAIDIDGGSETTHEELYNQWCQFSFSTEGGVIRIFRNEELLRTIGGGGSSGSVTITTNGYKFSDGSFRMSVSYYDCAYEISPAGVLTFHDELGASYTGTSSGYNTFSYPVYSYVPIYVPPPPPISDYILLARELDPSVPPRSNPELVRGLLLSKEHGEYSAANNIVVAKEKTS